MKKGQPTLASLLPADKPEQISLPPVAAARSNFLSSCMAGFFGGLDRMVRCCCCPDVVQEGVTPPFHSDYVELKEGHTP